MMKDAYYFGQLARQIDYYAFPRTGSHFLRYALSAMFDLVSRAHPHLNNPEAVDRQRELDEQVLYALDLREDGVPYAPVMIDALRGGLHGKPALAESPVLMLIRDPMATVYSLWRVNQDRWSVQMGEPGAWVRATLEQYAEFYDAAWQILRAAPDRSLLVRYEQLVAGCQELERIASFIAVRPKLRPSFAHWILRFERAVKPGSRTFYRAGDNAAWQKDERWLALLDASRDLDFTRFGYQSIADYLHSQPLQSLGQMDAQP